MCAEWFLQCPCLSALLAVRASHTTHSNHGCELYTVRRNCRIQSNMRETLHTHIADFREKRTPKYESPKAPSGKRADRKRTTPSAQSSIRVVHCKSNQWAVVMNYSAALHRCVFRSPASLKSSSRSVRAAPSAQIAVGEVSLTSRCRRAGIPTPHEKG